MSTEFNNLLHKFNEKNFNHSVNFQIYDINEYMVPNFFLENIYIQINILMKKVQKLKFNKKKYLICFFPF